LRVPSLREQRTIARVLGALNDRIELNRRMNETLEATARAIFKDWFVDFGPVRAKMDGRQPYLSPEIWDLLPDQINNDGHPDEWKLTELGKIASVTKGKSYQAVEEPGRIAGRGCNIKFPLYIRLSKTRFSVPGGG